MINELKCTFGFLTMFKLFLIGRNLGKIYLKYLSAKGIKYPIVIHIWNIIITVIGSLSTTEYTLTVEHSRCIFVRFSSVTQKLFIWY